jgi:hypothetical protein
MTIDEKNTMIENLLANCDTAMAAKAGLMHSEERIVIECEVNNKDFVWSSR